VLPLRDHRSEVVLRTRALSILADDGSGTSWDPIKVEGEAAVDVDVDVEVVEVVEVDIEVGESGEDEIVGVSMTELVEVSVTEHVAPALWEWDGTVADIEVPRRDAYALRLVVGRRLYDNGRLVSEAAVLGRVRRPFPLRISPHDAAALGVESGTEVRATSSRGSQVMAVEIDARVTAGIAQVEFSADGKGAAELIDANTVITDLRVETLR